MIKNIKHVLKIVFCLASLLSTAHGQSLQTPQWPAGNGIGYKDYHDASFSGSGVTQAAIADSGIKCTNVQWYVASANPGGNARVETINVYSDSLATNVIRFFITTNQTTLTNDATANTTNGLAVASTNGFVTGDFLLLRGVTNDWYQFLVISNFSTGNNIWTYQTYTNLPQNGDIVYKMTQAGSLTPSAPAQGVFIGAPYTNGMCSSVTFVNPNGLFSGQYGKPLMIHSIGCGSGVSNSLSVAGTYIVRYRN